MKKGIIKQAYAYVVCAICVAVAIVYLCIGIYGILKMTLPEFTMPQFEWQRVATFQSYKTEWEKAEKATPLSDDELRMRWQDKREVMLKSQQRDGTQNLVQMFIFFVIAIPIFLIHWKIAARVRLEEA